MEKMTSEEERLSQEAIACSLFAKNLSSIRGTLECFGDWVDDHDRLTASSPHPSDLPVMQYIGASFGKLLDDIHARRPDDLHGENRRFLLEFEASGIPFAPGVSYRDAGERVRRQLDCLSEWRGGQERLFDDGWDKVDIAMFRDVAERLGAILFQAHQLRPEAFEHRLTAHLLGSSRKAAVPAAST